MNYTPLPKFLITDPMSQVSVPGKEVEPIRPIAEAAAQNPEEVVPNERPQTEQYLEQVTDEIPLSEDLKKAGVQAPSSQGTLIIDGRMIHLPLSLEEVDDGMHKPLSSGKRWMAMVVQYVLDKLHLVIGNVGGKIGVVRSRK